MRSVSASTVTSLFGSLGLHGCGLLIVLLAARRPPDRGRVPPEAPNAWPGTSIEVDALATPQATPNLANLQRTEPEAAGEAAAPSEPVHAPPLAAPVPGREATEAGLSAETRMVPRRPPRAVAIAPARRPGAARVTAAAGQHEATTSAATGVFGSEGLPPGVRSLPSALTRAIPPATGADPVWQSLPSGTQRPFILAVEVNAEGRIGDARILSSHAGEDVPLQFEHVRQRVIALLGGGLFALQNKANAGRDLFRITITLSDRAVRGESGPAELVERGFDPPRGSSAGRAYFTLASGRHFEAKVEVLGAPSRPVHP